MIPQFANKQDLFNWLRENKNLLLHSKKSAIKYADAVTYTEPLGAIVKDAAEKTAGIVETFDTGNIVVRSVINTTNLLDSHGDVHIPGLWKKSLSEAKMFYLLQEHKMQFDKVITDEVKAFTKSVTWKSLGWDYEGSTQALMFDSTIGDRNEYMKDQYTKGYVKNHSVGMRYVDMFLCVNSEDKWWKEEKENYDKYIQQVANKEADNGWFWAVTTAKVIEGSAVLIGSNQATPTISITGADKITPETIEPVQATQTKSYLDIAQTILLTQKNIKK